MSQTRDVLAGHQSQTRRSDENVYTTRLINTTVKHSSKIFVYEKLKVTKVGRKSA